MLVSFVRGLKENVKHKILSIAINVKMSITTGHDHQEIQKIVAVAHDNMVSVVGYALGKEYPFGRFTLPMNVSHIFFVGCELVALSQNYIGVWRSQTWQSQRVAPITSYDVGGSCKYFIHIWVFFLLGFSSS